MKERLQNLLRDKGALHESDICRFNDTRGRFNNAFVINMPARTARLEKAKETLRAVGIDFTRFSAIVGAELADSDFAKQFDILRPGELGCLLSHLSIAALAADHPDQDAFTLVFEDDIVTSSGRDAMKSTLHKLMDIDDKQPIDLIYFGKCLERCGQMVQIKDNIFRAVLPMCCHSYAVKNSFARRMLEDLDKCHRHETSILNSEFFNQNIDSIYGKYISHGLADGVVLHPAIFYQDVLFGGSDLRIENMINYQECNDTNPPCVIPEEKQCWQGQGFKVMDRIIIAILIVMIVVILAIWQRQRVVRVYRSKAFKYSVIILILLIFIAMAVALVVAKMVERNRGDGKPDHLKQFDRAPNANLDTASSVCADGARNVIIDGRVLATREYNVFNPNGVFVAKGFKHNGENKDAVFVTTRCSNGKVSYPSLQVYNADMSKLLDSKKIVINSHRSMKSSDILGYEDMRIFRHKSSAASPRFYMIGVNLDRNPTTLPSMILVEFTHGFETSNTWHLRYEPVRNMPNKNWAPIVLPEQVRRGRHFVDELGFVVDIDPLLIVRRKVRFDCDDVDNEKAFFSENCELAYSAKKQTKVEKMRNSSITYRWADIPHTFRQAMLLFAPELDSRYSRYVLMGHTKYVESDFVKDGWLVLYQHYFVVIDLPLEDTSKSRRHHPKVYISNPFHIEQKDRPHIEYVSGFCFVPYRGEMSLCIMYGMKDAESKYMRLTPEEFSKLLRLNQ